MKSYPQPWTVSWNLRVLRHPIRTYLIHNPQQIWRCVHDLEEAKPGDLRAAHFSKA